MKSKILSSKFKNVYEANGNTTYYHQVTLDNVEGRYLSIGAKSESTPDFLQVGAELEWEWKDEARGSIKKAQAAFGGKGGKFIDQSNTQFIIAAMNNATALKIAGAIPDGETISSMIQRFTEHAVQLKKELV